MLYVLHDMIVALSLIANQIDYFPISFLINLFD